MNTCFGVLILADAFESPEKLALGGAIAGGTAAEILRDFVTVSRGGAILGGENIRLCDYIRATTGGFLVGGESDYEGDFDKVVSCTFFFKAPETLFVPPSERWDIPRLLKELE